MLAKVLKRSFIRGVIKDNMQVKKLFTDFGTEAIEEVHLSWAMLHNINLHYYFSFLYCTHRDNMMSQINFQSHSTFQDPTMSVIL